MLWIYLWAMYSSGTLLCGPYTWIRFDVETAPWVSTWMLWGSRYEANSLMYLSGDCWRMSFASCFFEFVSIRERRACLRSRVRIIFQRLCWDDLLVCIFRENVLFIPGLGITQNMTIFLKKGIEGWCLRWGIRRLREAVVLFYVRVRYFVRACGFLTRKMALNEWHFFGVARVGYNMCHSWYHCLRVHF